MGQSIDQSGCGKFPDPAKIIRIQPIDVAVLELGRASRNTIEHLLRIIEVMNRPENKIEFVPVPFDPMSPCAGSFGIVVELDPGPNLYVRISRTEPFNFVKVNAGVKTIMIGAGNIVQPATPRAIDPRLQQFPRVSLDPVPLRMGMVIRERLIVDC